MHRYTRFCLKISMLRRNKTKEAARSQAASFVLLKYVKSKNHVYKLGHQSRPVGSAHRTIAIEFDLSICEKF